MDSIFKGALVIVIATTSACSDEESATVAPDAHVLTLDVGTDLDRDDGDVECDGFWSADVCVNECVEPSRACGDGLDNDCDGEVDEVCPAECDVAGGCVDAAPCVVEARVWTSAPACESGLLELFGRDARDPPWRDSGAFVPADAGLLSAARSAVSAIVAADAPGESSPFTFCSLGDVIVGLSRPGSGRASFALRSGPAVALVVEAPHPFFELGTLDEAVRVFEELEARAILVSGSHRCAASARLDCDGTTSVCGSSGGFAISDVAHNTESVFHAVHQELSETFSTALVASLHGMSGEGASVSNGTGGPVCEARPAARLVASLAASLPAERVTSCNLWEGAPHEERLCGTTNVQGRHLNGSPNPCTAAAVRSSGRFLHIEQSRPLRDSPDEVVDALNAVIAGR